MSTRISAVVDDCLCFTIFYCHMIPIDCKITYFSLHLFVYFLVAIIIFGELTSATSKETTNIIFTGATPIN